MRLRDTTSLLLSFILILFLVFVLFLVILFAAKTTA
jgi:hypothetical protein